MILSNKRGSLQAWGFFVKIRNLEAIEKFKTDLQSVFGMLNYRGNTENELKKVLSKIENKGDL